VAHFGLGATGSARIYTLTDSDGKAFADVNLFTVRAGAGYAYLDGDLVLGAAVSHINFALEKPNGGKTLVSFAGYGAELGALYRPKHRRHRIGAAFRSAIASRPENDAREVGGVRSVEGLVLPRTVHVPWEVDIGFAYQFGERRANVPWRSSRELRRQYRRQILSGTYRTPDEYGGDSYQPLPGEITEAVEAALDHHRESERRYRRRQPRRYVLLAADLLLYGPTARGQSVSAFLLQEPERSGARIAYGARVGVESEIWQDRMKLRAGSYLEPSRVQRRYYRPHGTFGVDVRLFDFWRWSARGTATIDVAPRYFNWGLALGMWW
jgi:hypothetical protein